jgi:Ca2+-binding RTX toxin-like protein
VLEVTSGSAVAQVVNYATSGGVSARTIDATAPLTGFNSGLSSLLVSYDTADTLIGGSNSDLLVGGNGNNSMSGGGGNDFIFGGDHRETINGGDGNDVLLGHHGADELTGGTGNDVFVFRDRDTTRSGSWPGVTDTTLALVDRITDFNGNGASAGDQIRFVPNDANSFGTALSFGASTVATVTKLTLNNQENLFINLPQVQNTVSTSTNAQIVDVTFTGTGLAASGVTRVLILLDAFPSGGSQQNSAIDTFINITGVSGDLHASDFLFV